MLRGTLVDYYYEQSSKSLISVGTLSVSIEQIRRGVGKRTGTLALDLHWTLARGKGGCCQAPRNLLWSVCITIPLNDLPSRIADSEGKFKLEIITVTVRFDFSISVRSKSRAFSLSTFLLYSFISVTPPTIAHSHSDKR